MMTLIDPLVIPPNLHAHNIRVMVGDGQVKEELLRKQGHVILCSLSYKDYFQRTSVVFTIPISNSIEEEQLDLCREFGCRWLSNWVKSVQARPTSVRGQTSTAEALPLASPPNARFDIGGKPPRAQAAA